MRRHAPGPEIPVVSRSPAGLVLLGREVDLSKNTVAEIVKRSRLTTNILVEATPSAGSP
jgi:hypothetical protein